MGKDTLANLTLLVTSEHIVTTTTSLQLLQTVLFSLLTFYFGIQLYRRNKPKRDFDNIPGPPSLPIIGNLLECAKPGLDYFKRAEQYAKRYGRFFRLKIFYYDALLLCDPSDIQKLFSSTDPDHLSKAKLIYDVLGGDNIKHGLICSDYPTWKPHRKVINRLFTVSGIQHQLKVMNKHVKKLVTDFQFLLKDNNENGDVFDGGKVGKMIDFTTLDNILHIIMDMESVGAEERNEFHRNFLIFKASVSQRMLQPWLLLDWVWALHPTKKKLAQASQEFRKFVFGMVKKYQETKDVSTENICNKRKNETEREYEEIGVRQFKCMMEEMLDAGFNGEDIYQEMITMISAGHETVSSSMRFLLFRLALNPDIQQKCRKEVDGLFDEKLQGTGESSLSVDFSMHDLNSLEYLDRCVKENLRLAPIIPIFGRRLDKPLKLEKNLELDTKVLVGTSPWVIHRNPEYFPDPEKFDPDRFLPEECAKRHPYAYLPFSAGPRNCIGSKVAQLSIKLMTVFILRHFVVETKDRLEDVQVMFDITLTTKTEINLSLKERRDIS